MKLVIGTRLRDEIELLPWFLANTRFADRVCVVDGGSVDGSWEWLKEINRVNPRIRAKLWESHGGWYVEQGNHFRVLFDMVRGEEPDWFLYLDMDNIPSLAMQKRLKGFLESFPFQGIPKEPKTGVIMDEFSLAPGWITHYAEISPAPILFLWNFVPEVYNTDRDSPLYDLELPENTRWAPEEICQFHWNWAMPKRFAEKMVRYLGSPPAHGQTVSWHPDEKYTVRAPLPPYAQWHAPDGAVVEPEFMLNTTLNERG